MSEEKEVIIIRNATIKSLFDVVCVNYATQEADFVEKFLDFEQASELCDTLKALSTTP